MKTKEELNTIMEEVECLNMKPSALNGEELARVSGGLVIAENFKCKFKYVVNIVDKAGLPASFDGQIISNEAIIMT